MSKTKLPKIDNYFLIFFSVMLVFSVGVIVVFRIIFGAILTSSEVTSSGNDKIEKVDKEKLSNSYKFVFEKDIEKIQAK